MAQRCEICTGAVRGFSLRGGGTLQRCTQCQHLVRDLNAAPANAREAAYGGEPNLDRVRLALTFRAITRAASRRLTSVFEVGYGSGALLRAFLDRGVTVSGCDPDQLEVSVDPEVRDAARLWPVPIEEVPTDPTADLVFGVHVLEHVADPARTLAACRALLRPGGQIQFLTPAGDSLGPRRYGAAWWMLEDPTHVRFFTEDSLIRAAQDAGFIDIVVHRPVLDSLVTDAASVARLLSRRHHRQGVLATRGVLVGAAVTAPLVVLLRALSPRARPTLHLVASRP